ncbi:hypothetical protein B0T14DRAFT_568825 [Immersiella caudata]|uniref:Uncharacterized protein n=1 Tax=Immersiella caudata TaxID=314043 RepID=A0AA39WL07_9PEZI|nr:hypothetical protein B0T14DRAFT_568825 [Immersiella caudata]
MALVQDPSDSDESDETSSEFSFFEASRSGSPPPGIRPLKNESLDDSYATEIWLNDDYDTDASSVSGRPPFTLTGEDERLLAETYASLDPRSNPQDDVAGNKPPCTLGMMPFPVLTATGNVVVVKIDHRELFVDLDDLVDENKSEVEAPSVPHEAKMELA